MAIGSSTMDISGDLDQSSWLSVGDGRKSEEGSTRTRWRGQLALESPVREFGSIGEESNGGTTGKREAERVLPAFVS